MYALVLLTGWVLFTATELSASPVQVFECDVVSQHDLVPQGALESRFILRRHVIKKPPDSEFINTDWSLGRFTDNGSFEVEVFPTGQPGITEHSTSIRSAILDGRNSVRDEILDEALSTTETITVDGYKLEAFSMILSKQDGTAFDSHLDYPESFDLSEYNQKECTVNWRAPASLPCPGSSGTVSDEFPVAGESGEFNIVRVLEDNVALCEALAE